MDYVDQGQGHNGTFTNPRGGRENVCGRLVIQLEEVVQETNRLEFLVNRSKRLVGCDDFRIRLMLEDGVLTGDHFIVTPTGEAKTQYVVTAKRR